MLYEFECDSCENIFLRTLSMDDRNTPLDEPCPECGVDGKIHRVYSISGSMDAEILKADKRMENSGVQSALERIRDSHPDADMKWKG